MKIFRILIAIIVLFSACKSVKYADLDNGLYADIQTSRGDILIKLHEKEVPMTVANFVSLAEGDNPKISDSLKGKPFYDATKFHRVINNFMIQGGDITGTGSGSNGYKFGDEFPMNEKGELIYKHDEAGVLSMANSGRATNSSQFFITHKETPWLDGMHSIFGKVLLGQNIVDAIKQHDYINHIEIIRVGVDAKKFKAADIFEYELTKVEKRAAEYSQKIEQLKREFQEEKGINKAIETNSGLKILHLKKGTGKKVNPAIPTTVHYSIYLAEGKKMDSSLDRLKPFTFIVNDAKSPIITGWREGVRTMKEGGKAIFFIPYYLGYGESGLGPIIGKTDLVLEIEVLKVGR